MHRMGLPWTSIILVLYTAYVWFWSALNTIFLLHNIALEAALEQLYLYFFILEYNLDCKWPPWKPDAQNPLKSSSRTCDSWLWIAQQMLQWRSSLRCALIITSWYSNINCVNYFWSLTLDNYCCTCTLKAKACITSCIKINMCFKYFQHEYFN